MNFGDKYTVRISSKASRDIKDCKNYHSAAPKKKFITK
jgi:hypothetical protein